MDSPAPAPASADSRRPDPVPLSEEQKRNYQKDIDRFEEEKYASRNSFPTKLLGWMLIAGFLFELAGVVTHAHQDLGGILLLLAGIYVLKGSQSALRFASFFIIPAAVFGILNCVWSIAMGKPVDIGTEWHDLRDLKFWTLWVSPAMYFVAEAIIAINVFRLRKIPFWTKTVRQWATVVGILLLLQAGVGIRDLLRENEVRKTFSQDLLSARTFISRGGTIPFGGNAFEASPQVLRIRWLHRSGLGRDTLYEVPFRPPSKSEKLYAYEEWFKVPSGEWGKLKMEVVLPKNQ